MQGKDQSVSRQIIIQPDGKYAIWSAIVDDFILLDATEADVVGFFADEYLTTISKRVRQTIEKLKAAEKPYLQFTLTWEQAQRRMREVHDENDR
jgi:hypothetical protein